MNEHFGKGELIQIAGYFFFHTPKSEESYYENIFVGLLRSVTLKWLKNCYPINEQSVMLLVEFKYIIIPCCTQNFHFQSEGFETERLKLRNVDVYNR